MQVKFYNQEGEEKLLLDVYCYSETINHLTDKTMMVFESFQDTKFSEFDFNNYHSMEFDIEGKKYNFNISNSRKIIRNDYSVPMKTFDVKIAIER